MAGDWIKMRMELQTHPKIVRIMSATQSDKFRVIGGLHAVWCVFDQHSENGRLDGYTPDLMDSVIGWNGLSDAMIAVGWLVSDSPESLTMPDFDAHNGNSAKRRANDQERKRAQRKSPQSVRKVSASESDETRTREEKRREEKSINNNTSANASCIADIFEYWKSVMGKRNGAKLTPARKKCIESRLKDGYTSDQIKRAVDGCAKSPHHMGQNDSGTVYDDLTLICRNGEKLEQFMNNVAKFQGAINGQNRQSAQPISAVDRVRQANRERLGRQGEDDIIDIN